MFKRTYKRPTSIKISLSFHKLKLKYTPIDIPLSRNFFDFKEIMKSIIFLLWTTQKS